MSLTAVPSFYVDSRTCVRVGMDVSEWFEFNVYTDSLVREVNPMVLGKGMELMRAHGGGFEMKQQ